MTDLTDKWKAGKLEWDREYYVDLENNGIVKQLYLDEDGDFFDGMIDYSLKNKPYIEVLAPVPSYEEYQHLKELLKECKEEIEWYKADCGYKDILTESILTEIDNAIGEKK